MSQTDEPLASLVREVQVMATKQKEQAAIESPVRRGRGRPPTGNALTSTQRKALQRERDRVERAIEEQSLSSFLESAGRVIQAGDIEALKDIYTEMRRRAKKSAAARGQPKLVPIPDVAFNRSIARVAAKNSFRSGRTGDSELLAEARMTDKYTCNESEMMSLLRAELARVQGQSKGGHVAAVRRKLDANSD